MPYALAAIASQMGTPKSLSLGRQIPRTTHERKKPRAEARDFLRYRITKGLALDVVVGDGERVGEVLAAKFLKASVRLQDCQCLVDGVDEV